MRGVYIISNNYKSTLKSTRIKNCLGRYSIGFSKIFMRYTNLYSLSNGGKFVRGASLLTGEILSQNGTCGDVKYIIKVHIMCQKKTRFTSHVE